MGTINPAIWILQETLAILELIMITAVTFCKAETKLYCLVEIIFYNIMSRMLIRANKVNTCS